MSGRGEQQQQQQQGQQQGQQQQQQGEDGAEQQQDAQVGQQGEQEVQQDEQQDEADSSNAGLGRVRVLRDSGEVGNTLGDLLFRSTLSGQAGTENQMLELLQQEMGELFFLSERPPPVPQPSTAGRRDQAQHQDRGEEGATEETGSGGNAGRENMEEMVDTFLEFTGSEDRDRALRFLLAADGRLEQAVNLFLSGASLESFEPPVLTTRSRAARNQSTSTGGLFGTVNGAANEETRQPADAALQASWLYQRHLRHARAQNVMDSSLFAFTNDVENLVGGVLNSSRLSGQSHRILDDSQRASANVEALRAGMWEKTPEIGADCLRSVTHAERYLKLGLARVAADSLPIAICSGEDNAAVRLLQLIECLLRIVSDGHSDAVSYCGWWFIPPRRSSSRRVARNSYTEIFLKRVLPQDDIEALNQMWMTESFDPSWRDRKTEAEMLACALNKGCSTRLLNVLLDPVKGCRANVNPDPDRLGSLPTPLLLGATAVGFDRMWHRQQSSNSNSSERRSSTSSDVENDEDSVASSVSGRESNAVVEPAPKAEREAWSREVVEILLDAGAYVDDDVLAHLDSMTDAARELILAEKSGTRVSERLRKRSLTLSLISDELLTEWWTRDARKICWALLRSIALTKHDSTMHRSMEILTLLVERFRPRPHSDAVNTLGKSEYKQLMQLFQSVFAPENDDGVGLVLSIRVIEALLKATKAEQQVELKTSSATSTANQASSETAGSALHVEASESEECLGIHAQFCLSLCRFGIVARLTELGTGKRTINYMNSELEDLTEASNRVVSKISSCVVEKLGLTDETLLGRSAALVDVCDRLRHGDETVLEHLVWMMGQENNAGMSGHDVAAETEGEGEGEGESLDRPRAMSNENMDEGAEVSQTVYGDDGITAFEFEQSGLSSALLHFLMARDIDDLNIAKKTRTDRMNALLSAMPPPVVSQDDEAELEEEDDLKTDTSLTNRGSATEDGGIGTGDGDDGPGLGLNDDATEDEEGRGRGTLGRQASMTLESIQNLASNSLESIKSASKQNSGLDTSAFAVSALFRLVSKLQSVLAVHAAHNFPVLSHESTASSGGVRALVNPMKIHLMRDNELDKCTKPFPEGQDLVVQVLPLTPLHDFQRQVLRAVRIADPRYTHFCRKLVGRKILHRPLTSSRAGRAPNQQGGTLMSPANDRRSPVSSPVQHNRRETPRSPVHPSLAGGGSDLRGEANLALVVRYDPYTGAHLLQDLGPQGGKSSSHTSKSGSVPRFLNKKGNKEWFLMHLRDYEVLDRVFDGPSSEEDFTPVLQFQSSEESEFDGEGGGLSKRLGTKRTPLWSEGDEVAVWWRGDALLWPGWRKAKIVASEAVEEGKGDTEPSYAVEYFDDKLLFDDKIRIGDAVSLIDDVEELKRLALGHGGWTHDMPQFRGEVARVTSIRGTHVSTDGLGNYLYNVDALRKVKPPSGTNVPPGANLVMSEKGVPQRRICAVDGTQKYENQHVFSVFLLPEGASLPQEEGKQSLVPKEAESDTKGTKAPFKMNDRIEGRYAGKSRYYKGRIARVNADGTFDIAYDDGDSERGVKPELVCHIGQGPEKVVSFDFRKVFPNSIGKALFDALRTDDSVLGTEYNFVTRGFEHQPDFYASFAKSLEKLGSGVFAQFQTRQQAEILFDRVQRCGQSSKSSFSSRPPGSVRMPFAALGSEDNTSASAGDSVAEIHRPVRAYVDIRPGEDISPVVQRDISAAFEHVRDRFGQQLRQDPPPPPGHRAQVLFNSVDLVDPMTRLDETNALEMLDNDADPSEPRWLSATILGKRLKPAQVLEPESAKEVDATEASSVDISEDVAEATSAEPQSQQVFTCVLDDGRILWDVPESRVRVAQRTWRVFPFKTKERSEEDQAQGGSGENSSSKAQRERGHAEPIELTRQFTAFGQSTAYKRIRFSSTGEDDAEEGLASLDIQTVDEDTEDEYDSDGMDVIAPRFEVDFVFCRHEKDEDTSESTPAVSETSSAENEGSNLVRQNEVPLLANQNGEISMFQAMFQLQNMGTDLMPSPDTSDRASAVRLQSEYYLKWRVRCVFPGDAEFCEGSTTLKGRLPWRTPRSLSFEVGHNNLVTLETFCEKLIPIVPDFEDWARSNKLDDVVNYLELRKNSKDSGAVPLPKRAQLAVNWASICAAYAQLCQRPLAPSEADSSPCVSPIRSPTLLKKDMLGIKMIGSEAFSPGAVDALTKSLSETKLDRAIPVMPLDIPTDGDDLDQVRTLLEECGIEESVAGLRDTLLLLHLLYSELVPFDESADPLASAFGKSLPWRNGVLSDLLREQLSDPLSIATRCFPKWVATFPREFSFLFRTKVRQIHLRCTSLGVSRAVAWLQDEVTGYKAKKRQLAHVTLEISAMFRGVPDMVRYEHLQELSDRLEDELRAIEQELCIGQLHQDLVKVNRSELLHDAELLMRQHMHQRSELVVQFLDETGAGDGVTLDFYSSVAERLQLLEVNRELPMWLDRSSRMPSRNSELNQGDSTADGENAQSQVDEANTNASSSDHTEMVGGDADESKYDEEEDLHIVSKGGLFPQPLLPLGSVHSNVSAHGGLERNSENLLTVHTRLGKSLDADSAPKNVQLDEMAEGKEDSVLEKSRPNRPSHREECLRAARQRNNRVVNRFRFLGRLMAKALLDGMTVPIPLSPEFFMLLQQRQRKSFDLLLPMSTLALIEGSEVAEGGGSDVVDSPHQGKGVIQRLFELQQDGNLDEIKSILDELDLRFVDPSQPLEEDSFAPPPEASRSSHAEENQARGSGGELPSRTTSDEIKFENVLVPEAGAPAEELLAYAQKASLAGKSQADIEKALTGKGHAKLSRWKAIKGTQQIRTRIALENAELKEQARIEDGSLAAVELCPGGGARRVTVSNVAEYIELVLLWWLGSGIERQADAFCEGLRDVLGAEGRDALLFNFSHSELRRMLCGKEEIQWNEEDPLLGCIVPMGDYNERSKPIQMLVEALKAMSMRERAQFLNFVTAQPRVPLSGLPQIKVYPPMMECIPGMIIRAQKETKSGLRPGDRVKLANDYVLYDDAREGPLNPGEVFVVSKVDNRVLVEGWWYNSLALTLVERARHNSARSTSEKLAKAEWIKPNDKVRTAKVSATVSSWDPETDTVYFAKSVDLSVRRAFKHGQSLEVVPAESPPASPGADETSAAGARGIRSGGVSRASQQLPSFRVDKVLEQPQAVQMRPYLRPKATTCAKTLYLPGDYDSPEHLLESFRGAFSDAKLGGMNEN